MFLGQFPAHCQFAGAKNVRGLGKAFLEAILALKKDERPRYMGKSGKQGIAARGITRQKTQKAVRQRRYARTASSARLPSSWS